MNNGCMIFLAARFYRLGAPVRVRSHPGWTGNVDTSYDAHPDCAHTNPPPSVTGEKAPALYDGRDQVY